MDDFVFDLDNLYNLKMYEDYIDFLFSKINDNADNLLAEKLRKARSKSSFARKPGPGIADVYGYIIPADIAVESLADIPVQISIVTNPSINLSSEGFALLYLRLASIGSEFSKTFIALSKAPLEKLKGRIRLKARPILYCIAPYESIEDPRASIADENELYFVKALYRSPRSSVFTFKLLMENDKPITVEALHFVDERGDRFLLRDFRDTFPLTNRFMVVRPYLRNYRIGGIFIGPFEGSSIHIQELEAIPELQPTMGEEKTGGNASTRLSSNEFLLLYHCVDSHGIYYTYAALFDDNAELLALTEEPVIAPRPEVYSGRRPGTVFACGAVKVGGDILVTAGKDDEITIVYKIVEEELFEKLKFLKG